MPENRVEKQKNKLTNRDLLLPYAIPYLAYVAIVSLGGDRLSSQIIYILEICIVPGLLYWAWKWYVPFTGPEKITGSIVWGIIFGLAGLAIWCVLLAPFIDIAGEPWDFSAFILRLIAASLIVPVFEEVFIRGYVLRAALQWDQNRKNTQISSPLGQMLDHDTIADVPPGAWSVMAIVISTLAFTAGHLPSEWPASVAYSVLMSILWIMRKDLLSCMVAHGITNLALGIYVYFSGNWGFW
ncbi:MAG: CPBP family intramembrane metalloprotease [Proteobacteria bacterium]|nr:CPBP family intramembrane metalloprotease [Pseudomonadota bacterium]MBU1386668.1 CPBP family intramembrane metalloprotease [Pseudomonadota bacterium]MBU1543279.1 CPBP family intramembrane metalloprotease [Pseudomonadota bacterium]MBU2429691.1 CPBP family intramembrane metalloprotease [Pseudomonadota bacterium]MBU2483110.1 CPBP family intramembrane metalloprotease [Pseudomonadota bacterium]